MPEWLSETVAVIQLVLNGVALLFAAIVWKLYVANLKAVAESKDATIETVEKSRDYWKEKAEELEKRSPEVLEKLLEERIQIMNGELVRLNADKEVDKLSVRALELDKAGLEQDLFRTQGFRTMLALEAIDDGEELLSEAESEAYIADMPSKIEVEFIGEVAVDSGQLMITDPCYVDSEWRREAFSNKETFEGAEETLFNYSYDGACRATLLGPGYGELAFGMGHAGAGVAFATAWGDGGYPVYAEKHDGRIVRVYVSVC